MSGDKDQRLNWQQACKFMGCSKSHFYNLVNCGELPAVRYGRSRGTMVKESDCRRYLCKWQKRTGEEVSADISRA